METYSFLRELADSWVLLALCIFYIGAIAWAFRPGSRAVHDEIANIPLKDDAESANCQDDRSRGEPGRATGAGPEESA
ncbi:MAG: cbb3-type cytochrome c oxidase subunit 3 [Boseongicola sp.]|nr:cbb3-type cytochrome c oxidase subunit 3 [Boseongicola sp.]